MIINYFIILYAFNFHHKSYVNKDSFNNYFALSLNLQTNKQTLYLFSEGEIHSYRLPGSLQNGPQTYKEIY